MKNLFITIFVLLSFLSCLLLSYSQDNSMIRNIMTDNVKDINKVRSPSIYNPKH